MAAYYPHTTQIGGRSFATRLARAAHGFAVLVSDFNARRATRAALDQLTDRELDDIGLTRWDVNRMY